MTRALLAALAVGLLFAGGCMKMHTETTIGPDGSGTATVHFSMAQEVADAVKELSEMPDNQMGQTPPSLADISKQEIEEAAAKYGVKVKRFDKISADGRSGIEMELAYKQLSDLSHVLGGMMGDDEEGLGLFRTEDGNYLLTTTELDLPEEEPESEDATATDAAEMDPEAMQKSMAIMQQLMAHMNELDISMKITVPGDVIESNAPQVDGRTSIWKVDATNMMQVEGEMEPKIKFSSKGVDIDAPQYTEADD